MLESLGRRTTLLLFVLLASHGKADAAEKPRLRLPDEIEAVGGQGTALGHAGAASLSDLGAVRLNPAMLYEHRSYDVGAGYYWPSTGRPFYKAGVVDGVTSQIVMGFEYTGFQEQLKSAADRKELDSPVFRRGSLALSVPGKGFALGFAVHYVEAKDPENTDPQDKPVKGTALGAGLAVPIGSSFRLGASVENFNNKRIAAVAPRAFRAGINWQDSSKVVSLSADYRDRQRSLAIELPPELASTLLTAAERDVYDEPERMGILGLQVKTFDLLRFFAAYGRNVDGLERTTASGGIGVFQKNYSLAYAVSKSFPAQDELQSSLYLSVIMKM